MKHLLCIVLMVVGLAACRPTDRTASGRQAPRTDTIVYAHGFTVERFAHYTSIEVRNPWDSVRVLQRYLLVPRHKPLPDLPDGMVVRVPVHKAAVFSSVHVAMIGMLGEADRISGVCEPEYISNPHVKEGLQTGRIANLGVATSPDVEQILLSGTEVVIASSFEHNGYGTVEKIGIPVIQMADHMESFPLGCTEWIRFYGLLFDKEALADSLFHATEQRYNALKALADTVSFRPSVLTDKPFSGVWYTPAGQSFVTRLLSDAGALHAFNHLPGTGAVPLSFETVLEQAMNADFWLIKYNQPTVLTYRSLGAEYAPFRHFTAFGRRRIYTCHTGRVPYYEEYPLYPDRLLANLIGIFHPHLLADYSFRYYQPMPNPAEIE